MNLKICTDHKLTELRSIPKRVRNPGARWSEKPRARPVHKQRILQATGLRDEHIGFSLYLRQNLVDPNGFSCGIAYLPPSGSPLTLARYNGSSHIHGQIAYRPHIHRATEKAIAAGRIPESEAEKTDRYETLDAALACLVDDFHLDGITTRYDQPRMF